MLDPVRLDHQRQLDRSIRSGIRRTIFSGGFMKSASLPGSRIIPAIIACLCISFSGIVSLKAQDKTEDPATQSSSLNSADKSSYTIFHPTPPEKMREFNPDRPDKTESPYTVDAGHFALETGLISYTYNHIDKPDPSRPEHQILVGDNNFKVGLLNNMDLQFLVQSFLWQRVKTGTRTHSEDWGVGDVEVRAKVNLWGNDEGKTAMAVMPWLGFPTNQLSDNNQVTGGMIFPFGFEALGWKIGLMTETDAIGNGSGSGHHLEWVNTIACHHDIIEGKLDGYVEFFSNNSFETGSPWAATVDLGLIYEVNKNLYLDIGVNIGVTSNADDLNPFIGFSKRF
jgi:hypothetical protein